VPGLRVRPLALDSKPAPYSPHRARPVPGDNLGMLLQDAGSGRSIFYAPGLGDISPAVWEAMTLAHTVLVDGTFWTDDEMIALGLSATTARDIGHLPQSGPGGMHEHLARLPRGVRKLLIHINNTNPILDTSSPQHRQLQQAGVELAQDGMEIEL
jgi:pyrroloquinoline quinone biosynthesis protein B